jgi:hypothetical protein
MNLLRPIHGIVVSHDGTLVIHRASAIGQQVVDSKATHPEQRVALGVVLGSDVEVHVTNISSILQYEGHPTIENYINHVYEDHSHKIIVVMMSPQAGHDALVKAATILD